MRQVDTARAAQRFDLSGYGGIGTMEVRKRVASTCRRYYLLRHVDLTFIFCHEGRPSID